MLLGPIHTLNNHMAVIQHTQHSTALAFVFSGQDDHLIAFTNSCHDSLSQNLGRKRDDLHELLGTQLTGNRPKNTGTDRL